MKPCDAVKQFEMQNVLSNGLCCWSHQAMHLSSMKLNGQDNSNQCHNQYHQWCPNFIIPTLETSMHSCFKRRVSFKKNPAF